jgi:hypothetical protein
MKKAFILVLIITGNAVAYSQGFTVNHNCTRISQIPESAVTAAKQKLHIAYGHTSHGSQLTDGMTGLVAFMNGKGYPVNLYSWNNGGTGGALDLHDYAMGGDVGYYPDWVNNTRAYLGTPDPVTGRGTGINADVNVIIWSWCGQVTGKYLAGTLSSEYLIPMSQLEADYPGIKFIYMTGHLDHSSDAANKAANQAIRDFCSANNKILYDFADIESYNPDQIWFQYASDDCSYYSASGTLLGNWAIEWQNSHTLNVDWYNCNSAHSQPLNANQKAYAAWWLWARLGGWDGTTGTGDIKNDTSMVIVYPNPCSGKVYLRAQENRVYSVEIYNLTGSGICTYSNISLVPSAEIDISRLADGLYVLRITDGERTFFRRIVAR